MKITPWKTTAAGREFLIKEKLPHNCKITIEGDTGLIEEIYTPIIVENIYGGISLKVREDIESENNDYPSFLRIYLDEVCVFVSYISYDSFDYYAPGLGIAVRFSADIVHITDTTFFQQAPLQFITYPLPPSLISRAWTRCKNFVVDFSG